MGTHFVKLTGLDGDEHYVRPEYVVRVSSAEYTAPQLRADVFTDSGDSFAITEPAGVAVQILDEALYRHRLTGLAAD